MGVRAIAVRAIPPVQKTTRYVRANPASQGVRNEGKPKRRSRFQVHATRKKRYSVHLGGDTGRGGRAGYVIQSGCTKPWQYWLTSTREKADAKLDAVNTSKCSYQLSGLALPLEFMPPR